jgi:hypothetical protein
MSTLAKLKFTAAVRKSGISPVQHRRNKLSNKLYEQIELARAQSERRTYAPTRLRTVTDTDGNRKQMEMPKRVKAWWFVADGGRIVFNVRYGAKVVEFSKGKNAVEVASPAELVAALQAVKTAVEAGELDAQITAASGELRKAFAQA